MTKTCAKCRETKSVTEFGPGKKWRDGLFPYCRPCARAANKVSQDRYRQKYRAAALAAYHANPAPVIAAVRARELADPEAANARKRAWAKANPDKVRAANSKWQQANMATAIRASNARRRAVKSSAPHIQFDAQQILDRVAYFGGRCWICRGEYDALDHVKPLSKGGWHCLSNLRPICTPCNTRKLNHWPYVLTSTTTTAA